MELLQNTRLNLLRPYSQSLENYKRYSLEASEDDFLFQPRIILHTKLEVLASEMIERVEIQTENLRPLKEERLKLHSFIERFEKWISGEEFREYRDQLFEVQKEIRRERVEGWRDVSNVMRDFLEVWQAYQEARTTSIFIGE